MSGKKSRFKIQRRLLTELPGLGKKGALERRPYPPGEHGQKRKKYSDYGLRLEEKQKILFHYGLREEQLRRFIRAAKKGTGANWTEIVITLLEKRLDNIVFRLGFASSIPAAKQLISHKKVLVNGQVTNIVSKVLKIHDVVTLKPVAYENQVYLHAKQSPRLELPDWLEKSVQGGIEQGKLKDDPTIHAVPFAFDPSLFTVFYSMRKV